MAFTVERHASLASTMDTARERARAGAPDGTVVVAERMTAGRGTHGRAWAAPEGGLYLSIVLRGLADPHLLTLALGNAVADALEVAGVDPKLKWVNDVWLDGRKVAGILVEGEATADRFDFLVAGIGLNVNGRIAVLPKELHATATTLEESLGCDSCIPDLEAFLLQAVEKWVGLVRQGRGAEIVATFRSRDALSGKEVVVEDGKARVAGTAKGIDERGRLLVESAGKTQAVATGTVRLA